MFMFIVLYMLEFQGLIKELGNDDFQKRETATKKLEARMDFATMLYLEKIVEEQKDLEIRTRINRLICNYRSRLRSEYKIDLKGYGAYPQIDEGMPEDYKLGGPWAKWERCYFISYYLNNTGPARTPGDYYPFYMKWRRATALWMQERMDYDFQQSIDGAKSETEFRDEMKKRMDDIQKDVAMLVEGDKKFYLKNKWYNPFLEKSKEK